MFDWITAAFGRDLPYVVLQVTLKEGLIGTGSENLSQLERVINRQVSKGYRLHTMSTANGGSKGLGGGDRIQATLVFERLDLQEAFLKNCFHSETASLPNTYNAYIEDANRTPQPTNGNNPQGETIDENAVTPIEVDYHSGKCSCPVCGQRQNTGRRICMNCGVAFVNA